MSAPQPLSLPVVLAGLLLATVCTAQPFAGGTRGGGGRRGGGGFGGGLGGGNGPMVRIEGGELVNQDTVHTARETATHSVGLPNWTNPPEFKGDTFTFARLVYSGSGRGGRGGLGGLGGGGGHSLWYYDYPDADLNLSARLQQLTSLKVDPDARVVRLTDTDLYSYPFLYTVHVESMALNEVEIVALRKYLHTGGALMVGDFWGTQAWNNLASEMQHVLPGSVWVDLPPNHPVFHGVFDLKLPLANLQVPTISVDFWNRDYNPADPNSRATISRGLGSLDMHVRAWLDDKGRIMVIALHNCDISDGWEREGENQDYFRQFAETRAYPLAINIIYYLMTH